jgi:hypothetical protein
MSSEAGKERKVVRIELTEPQQDAVFQDTGRRAEAIELSPVELEERIAPRKM